MKVDSKKMLALGDQMRSSGMSRGKFAKERGLSAHSLRYWDEKFYGKPIPVDVSSPDKSELFVELLASDKKTERSFPKERIVELALPYGIRLTIYRDHDDF